MRILIVKYSAWSLDTYESTHPEYQAIRDAISRHPKEKYVLVGLGGARYESFRKGRITFYNLSMRDPIRVVLSLFMEFALVVLLRPSVVAGFGVVDLVPLWAACFVTNVRLVSIVTGEPSYEIQRFPKLLRPMMRFSFGAALVGSFIILAVSRKAKQEIEHNFRIEPSNIVTYTYGISEIFNPEVPRDLKAVLNPDGPIVLYVGRIDPQKGLEYLVEASRFVAERMPNVKFVVKAPMSNKRYVESLRSTVRDHGVQRHFTVIEESSRYSEIPRYMVAADIFVLPSVSEGTPVVVLEALACGLPVLATRVGGIPDVVHDRVNGLLVEPKDGRTLAERILELLLNPDLRKELSRGALASAQTMRQNEFGRVFCEYVYGIPHTSR